MSVKTARMEAQLVLLILYGGKLRHNEMGYTEEQVAFMFLEERDRLMERGIEKDGETRQPEQSCYTLYESLDILQNPATNEYYLPFPNGAPVECLHDMGVRLMPVKGGGAMFVRTAPMWCDVNPDLSWLEGNIAWEYRSDRIVFPNLQPGTVGKVAMEIMETRQTDIDAPLRCPARHVADCRDLVMERLGIGRHDRRQDAEDQRTGGAR